MQDPELQSAIERVAACGPLKAWSVIVTVLGDLCRDRDDWLSARVLNALIAPFGINGQATRVAVHRLKRDGWLETERRGRESFHRLSSRGWTETKSVWPMVYGAEAPNTGVHVLIGSPDLSPSAFAKALPAHAVILGPRIAMVPGQAVLAIGGCLSAEVERGTAPGWVADLIVDAGSRQEYRALNERLSALTPPSFGGGLQAKTSLRLIVLHHWRRLCLRRGGLAEMVMSGDWEGAHTRTAVMQVLSALPPPRLADLDGAFETDRPSERAQAAS